MASGAAEKEPEGGAAADAAPTRKVVTQADKEKRRARRIVAAEISAPYTEFEPTPEPQRPTIGPLVRFPIGAVVKVLNADRRIKDTMLETHADAAVSAAAGDPCRWLPQEEEVVDGACGTVVAWLKHPKRVGDDEWVHVVRLFHTEKDKPNALLMHPGGLCSALWRGMLAVLRRPGARYDHTDESAGAAFSFAIEAGKWAERGDLTEGALCRVLSVASHAKRRDVPGVVLCRLEPARGLRQYFLAQPGGLDTAGEADVERARRAAPPPPPPPPARPVKRQREEPAEAPQPAAPPGTSAAFAEYLRFRQRQQQQQRQPGVRGVSPELHGRLVAQLSEGETDPLQATAIAAELCRRFQGTPEVLERLASDPGELAAAAAGAAEAVGGGRGRGQHPPPDAHRRPKVPPPPGPAVFVEPIG